MSHITKTIELAPKCPESNTASTKSQRAKMLYDILEAISILNDRDQRTRLSDILFQLEEMKCNASRNSVRNALRVLEAHKFVTYLPDLRARRITLSGVNALIEAKINWKKLRKPWTHEIRGFVDSVEDGAERLYRIVTRKYRRNQWPTTCKEPDLWSLAYIIFTRFKQVCLTPEEENDLDIIFPGDYALSPEEENDLDTIFPEEYALNPSTWLMPLKEENRLKIKKALELLEEYRLLNRAPNKKGWSAGEYARMALALMQYPDMPEKFETHVRVRISSSSQCLPELAWLTINVLGYKVKTTEYLVVFLSEILNLKDLSSHLYNESFLECFNCCLGRSMVRGQDVLYVRSSFLKYIFPKVESTPCHAHVAKVQEEIKNTLKQEGPMERENFYVTSFYDQGRNLITEKALENLLCTPGKVSEIKFRGKHYVYVSDNEGKELINGEQEFVTHEGNFFDHTMQATVYPFIGWAYQLCFAHPGVLLEGNTFKPGDKPFIIKEGEDGDILSWYNGRWVRAESLITDKNLGSDETRFRILQAIIYSRPL